MTGKTAVLPICTFGNIVYYSHYLLADKVILDRFEHYPKQTFRNRYEILGPNGRQGLTVPVTGQKGIKTPFREIEIVYREDWQTIHWRSIVTAYQRSPFFEFYKDELKEVLFSKSEKLIDFNLGTHNLLKSWINLENEEIFTDKYFEGECDWDLRESFKPSKVSVENAAYLQVFSDRHPFAHNLSVLDLVFNLGTQSKEYLKREKSN
jgi:hypothetical protein